MQTIIGGAGGTAPADVIKDTDTAHFMADVIEASRETPVIVDFWAPWCGPCKQLTPVLEKVVLAAKGKVRLVKMNIDENPELAQQMRIQSIPAVYAFVGGRPVDGFMGALPESQIRQFVDNLLRAGGDDETRMIDEALAQAAELLEAGDVRMAGGLYTQVLQADPSRTEALAGLSQVYVKMGDLEKAREVLAHAPEEMAKDPHLVRARTAIDLAEKAAGAGETAALEAKLAADPGDHATRMELAMALYAAGDAKAAIDQLLEIVRRDREWNDNAARTQLFEIFDALGPKDPVAQSGRRKLTSILFA